MKWFLIYNSSIHDVCHVTIVYCKCLTFGDVFFLGPLAVDVQIKHIAEYASINVQVSGIESNDKSNPRYLAESVTSTKYCTLKI